MPRKRQPSTVEVGLTGLKQYHGHIYEEWHPKLRGLQAMRIYEEMRDNDATVGAVLYAIEGYLRAVKWYVEGGTKKEREFLKSCMDDMESPWEDFVSDVLSMLTYGYSLFEKVYKVRVGPQETNPRWKSSATDGRIGWRKLALRPQNTIWRWEIDNDTGELYGAHQVSPTAGITQSAFLPIDRCILFRTRPFKSSPEGRSLLRNSYRSYYLKKRLEEIEAIGASRDNVGVPVVHVPVQLMSPNATPDQKAARSAMETLASQLHRDEREGIVFPSETNPVDGQPTGYKLSLLASPGSKVVAIDPIIRRYDARILMSMAAEFLILGTEKQGSFALGAKKSENFLLSLRWYIDTIAATVNKQAVEPLYDANGVDQKSRARIVPGDIDSPGLQELGQFLMNAAAGGFITPTANTEKKLREFAHLPLDEDLEDFYDFVSVTEDPVSNANQPPPVGGPQPPPKPTPPGTQPRKVPVRRNPKGAGQQPLPPNDTGKQPPGPTEPSER